MVVLEKALERACQSLDFFWLGHRPHLRIKDVLEKEVSSYWKNRKSFPIIPKYSFQHFKLLKSAINTRGGEAGLLPLWHYLNSKYGGEKHVL